MTKEIRFASSNPLKLAEIKKILPVFNIIGIDHKIQEIQTEDQKELVKDKLLKAFEHVGRPVLVEHTGLFLSQLNGLPGGLTQIFWDTLKADRFSALFGKSDATVIARTTIGFCDGMKLHYFSGEAKGRIAPAPAGDRTFQWDCVFAPEEFPDKTYAELGERKNDISMRRRAFDEFLNFTKANT